MLIPDPGRRRLALKTISPIVRLVDQPFRPAPESRSWSFHPCHGVVIDLMAPVALVSTLAARWGSPLSPAPVEPRPGLSVEWSEAPPSSVQGEPEAHPFPHLELSRERLSLFGPACRAELDPASGAGRLWLSGSRAAAAVQLDYALRVVCALKVAALGGLLFHGAGLIWRGQAYLMLGASGAGKTTAARNAGGARILNDDLVILLPGRTDLGPSSSAGTWSLHASPFTHPQQAPPSQGQEQAPLAGILDLVQAETARVRPLSRAMALVKLLAAVPVLPADPGRVDGLLRTLSLVQNSVPCAQLHLRPEPTYWPAVEAWQDGLARAGCLPESSRMEAS